MDLAADFKVYQDRITSSLVSVTRTASQISAQDVGFYRSSSDKFSQSFDAQNAHLLRLTNKLLKAACKDTSVKLPSLQNCDDIEDNWRQIVDVVDDLLEKADRSLDEFSGVIKRLSPGRQDGAEPTTKKTKLSQSVDQRQSNQIPKPQLLFAKKVNNYETGPWMPLLLEKPHGNMPLEDSIGTGVGGFKHPYAHEIQNMIYPTSVYQVSTPIPYSPPGDSQAIFVDTEEAAQDMLKELKLAKEIAIDLEHNDRNSYIGLVCLMQISTRDKDWIIDTLKPWRENLQMLNEVFANPRIVKILHGSTSDIIWLQRDLGLYIVGLFDTYHASNALQFPAKSLKYLLQRFANFEAQKQYQLADWRIRPLPQELIDYARSDTHFLLYIYDHLRNMLLEASSPHDNLIEHVLDSSRREALQVYERPVYDSENGLNPGGWMRLLLQRASHLTNEQLGVFRATHEWRDKKARELDEGDQNVMPNAFVWTIAETMPTYRGAFHQRGIGRLPRYVAENIPEIIEVVKQGMAQGKEGPSVHELIEKHSNKAGFMFGRNKYVRKRPEESNNGVGATVQMLNESGELPTVPSIIPTPETVPQPSDEPIISKAAMSQLWGTIEPLTSYIKPDMSVVSQALGSILPLQGISQTQFSATNSSAPIAVINPLSSLPESRANTAVTDPHESFIIKGNTRKRKASDAVSLEDQAKLSSDLEEADSVQDFLTLSQPNGDPDTQAKHAAKEARKAEKIAKKAAEAQERIIAQANMVPFDYANAKSVLYAKSEVSHNGDANGKKANNKPLNPFAKALDTSTGAKRSKMGKELPGRSHTFKN